MPFVIRDITKCKGKATNNFVLWSCIQDSSLKDILVFWLHHESNRSFLYYRSIHTSNFFRRCYCCVLSISDPKDFSICDFCSPMRMVGSTCHLRKHSRRFDILCEVWRSTWLESESESERIGEYSACFAFADLAFSAKNLSLIALTSCLRTRGSWDILERKLEYSEYFNVFPNA